MKNSISRIVAILVIAFSAHASNLVAQESTFEPNQRVNLSIGGVPPEEALRLANIYTVSTDYTLNLPYIPRISIRGLTRSQIEKKIEDTYKAAKIYTDPNVNITVDVGEGTTRIVTVAGEVNRAGPIPFRSGMTMLEAIGAAGNQTDFGSVKSIKLIRNGKTTEHDLSKIASNPQADVTLKPNDKIIVPPSGGIFNFN